MTELVENHLYVNITKNNKNPNLDSWVAPHFVFSVTEKTLSIETKKSLFVRQDGNHSSHCVKSVRIRSFSGPYFPASGLTLERYGVSLRIQSEFGKIRTRKTPNTDTFHEVTAIFEKLMRFILSNGIV